MKSAADIPLDQQSKKGFVRQSSPALVALAVAVLAAYGCKRESPPSPDVWAVVNGQEIKRDEVEKYYRSSANPEAQETSPEETLSLKLDILEELVRNEILIQRARKLGLEASDGEVEDKFTETKRPFTEDEFQRQLKDRNVTVDDLKRDLRKQLSIQKLINREVMSRITITDQEVLDFYNQNRAQFNVTEVQYRVGRIVVTPQKDLRVHNRKNDKAANDTEARRKAAALEARLNAGADFSQLAMDYSEDPSTLSTGGDMGYISESSLTQTDPALKRAVLALQPGQISPVITLRDGYVILKLVAKEAPGQRDFNDVQQSIRDMLRNRKEQLLRNAYIASARDEAKVVNYLAKQIVESAGKLPAATPSAPPPAAKQ